MGFLTVENNQGRHKSSLLPNSETHGLQYHSPLRECLCYAVSISQHGSVVWRISTLQSCSRPAKADCAHVLTALCNNLRGQKVYSLDEYISKIENCYIYQLLKTFRYLDLLVHQEPYIVVYCLWFLFALFDCSLCRNHVSPRDCCCWKPWTISNYVSILEYFM